MAATEKALKFRGVIVPMITPATADGKLDEPAVDRTIDWLLAGGVDGIFVIGTTSEGGAIPVAIRQKLVEQTIARVNHRAIVFAGLGDGTLEEVETGNKFLAAGVDAIVSRPPTAMATDKLLSWYQALLDKIEGPLLIYNILSTSKVSIPLDIVEKLIGHPRLVGMKDSEANATRHAELIKRFGNKPGFSVLIGVGSLMESGLRQGADGIVPSVGNLIPDTCKQLCLAAEQGNWIKAHECALQMEAVANLFQKGRSMGESLVVLKAIAHEMGLCSPNMWPPLKAMAEADRQKLPDEMRRLGLGKSK